jgi:hypothetical protein
MFESQVDKDVRSAFYKRMQDNPEQNIKAAIEDVRTKVKQRNFDYLKLLMKTIKRMIKDKLPSKPKFYALKVLVEIVKSQEKALVDYFVKKLSSRLFLIAQFELKGNDPKRGRRCLLKYFNKTDHENLDFSLMFYELLLEAWKHWDQALSEKYPELQKLSDQLRGVFPERCKHYDSADNDARSADIGTSEGVGVSGDDQRGLGRLTESGSTQRDLASAPSEGLQSYLDQLVYDRKILVNHVKNSRQPPSSESAMDMIHKLDVVQAEMKKLAGAVSRQQSPFELDFLAKVKKQVHFVQETRQRLGAFLNNKLSFEQLREQIAALDFEESFQTRNPQVQPDTRVTVSVGGGQSVGFPPQRLSNESKPDMFGSVRRGRHHSNLRINEEILEESNEEDDVSGQNGVGQFKTEQSDSVNLELASLKNSVFKRKATFNSTGGSKAQGDVDRVYDSREGWQSGTGGYGSSNRQRVFSSSDPFTLTQMVGDRKGGVGLGEADPLRKSSTGNRSGQMGILFNPDDFDNSPEIDHTVFEGGSRQSRHKRTVDFGQSKGKTMGVIDEELSDGFEESRRSKSNFDELTQHKHQKTVQSDKDDSRRVFKGSFDEGVPLKFHSTQPNNQMHRFSPVSQPNKTNFGNPKPFDDYSARQSKAKNQGMAHQGSDGHFEKPVGPFDAVRMSADNPRLGFPNFGDSFEGSQTRGDDRARVTKGGLAKKRGVGIESNSSVANEHNQSVNRDDQMSKESRGLGNNQSRGLKGEATGIDGGGLVGGDVGVGRAEHNRHKGQTTDKASEWNRDSRRNKHSGQTSDTMVNKALGNHHSGEQALKRDGDVTDTVQSAEKVRRKPSHKNTTETSFKNQFGQNQPHRNRQLRDIKVINYRSISIDKDEFVEGVAEQSRDSVKAIVDRRAMERQRSEVSVGRLERNQKSDRSVPQLATDGHNQHVKNEAVRSVGSKSRLPDVAEVGGGDAEGGQQTTEEGGPRGVVRGPTDLKQAYSDGELDEEGKESPHKGVDQTDLSGVEFSKPNFGLLKSNLVEEGVGVPESYRSRLTASFMADNQERLDTGNEKVIRLSSVHKSDSKGVAPVTTLMSEHMLKEDNYQKELAVMRITNNYLTDQIQILQNRLIDRTKLISSERNKMTTSSESQHTVHRPVERSAEAFEANRVGRERELLRMKNLMLKQVNDSMRKWKRNEMRDSVARPLLYQKLNDELANYVTTLKVQLGEVTRQAKEAKRPPLRQNSIDVAANAELRQGHWAVKETVEECQGDGVVGQSFREKDTGGCGAAGRLRKRGQPGGIR